MQEIDLFLCCGPNSGVWKNHHAELRRLASPYGLSAIVNSATCVAPDWVIPAEDDRGEFRRWNFATDLGALDACAAAADRAGRTGRSLLVMLEPVRTGSEAIGTLMEVLGRDPHFGFAVPRFCGPDGSLRKLLPSLGDPEIDNLPRRVLSELPESYLLPEFAAPCFLVRGNLLANLPVIDTGFETLEGAWHHYMTRARRMGFRCAVANNAVMEQALPCRREVEQVHRDFWQTHHKYPCVELARREVLNLPAHVHESLIARAGHEDLSISRTLLIDATGVAPCFNGTTHAALELVHGLLRAGSGWRMLVQAKPESIQFHDLTNRFAGCEVAATAEGRYFTAALRLSQPWDFETMFALHSRALFNFHLMLDTISWDVLYNGGSALQTTWRFLTQYADGVMYISQYTLDRMRARFPRTRRDYVCRLSLCPQDYVSPAGQQAEPPAEPYIFVAGNNLDHKHVGETLEFLASAFPFHRFKALGSGVPEGLGNVEGIPSGLIPDEEIERLYAQARIIVFPSFYEGFGFPVLKGLSYGRVVVARRSELLEEVASRYAGPGLLYGYESPDELLELSGRLLHGEAVVPMNLGSAIKEGHAPLRWGEISARLLETVEEWTKSPADSCWVERQQAIEYAKEYREQMR